MRAFTAQTVQPGLEQGFIRTACLEAGHIRIQFLDLDLTAGTVNQIVPSIIIKEHGCVMVHAVKLRPGPCAVFNIVRFVNVGLACTVAAEKHIKVSVMIPQTGGPLAMCIIVLTIGEVLHIPFCQPIIYIRADFPGYQILGLHNRCAGTEEHGGADHIICIPHPDHILIRHIRPDNRIGHCGNRRSLSRKLLLLRQVRQGGKDQRCRHDTRSCPRQPVFELFHKIPP